MANKKAPSELKNRLFILSPYFKPQFRFSSLGIPAEMQWKLGLKGILRCPRCHLCPSFEKLACHTKLHRSEVWGEWWGSNPRQPEPQSGALPTELHPPFQLVLSIRFLRQKSKKPYKLLEEQ